MTPNTSASATCRCTRKPFAAFYNPFFYLWWMFPSSAFALAFGPIDSPAMRRNVNSPSTLRTQASPTIAPTPNAVRRAAASTDTMGNGMGSGNPGSDSDSSSLNNDGVVNLYFLFIAVVAVLLLLILYFLHRRKKKIKAMQQATGQAHLARDLDGWSNTRRWIHGNRAPQESGLARPDEGLNEHGEAPPPYHPASAAPPGTVPVASGAVQSTDWNNSAGLAIPMRTMTRDSHATKPPDYHETVVGEADATQPTQSAIGSTTNLTRTEGETSQHRT